MNSFRTYGDASPFLYVADLHWPPQEQDAKIQIPDYQMTADRAERAFQRLLDAGAPDWMRSRARAVIRELRWDEMRRRHKGDQ